MAQNGTHKNEKKIFFNDQYTNTKPNSLCNFYAVDIAKIKGHPLARLYPIVTQSKIKGIRGAIIKKTEKFGKNSQIGLNPLPPIE